MFCSSHEAIIRVHSALYTLHGISIKFTSKQSEFLLECILDLLIGCKEHKHSTIYSFLFWKRDQDDNKTEVFVPKFFVGFF